MYGRRFLANTRHKQRYCNIEIIEKGTLKATDHDKSENIAGSVCLSLFIGSIGNAFYCPRRLAPCYAQLSIYTS
jgi:hypothetical protein